MSQSYLSCPHCGNPLDLGETFCGECGQPIGHITRSSGAYSFSHPDLKNAHPDHKRTQKKGTHPETQKTSSQSAKQQIANKIPSDNAGRKSTTKHSSMPASLPTGSISNVFPPADALAQRNTSKQARPDQMNNPQSFNRPSLPGININNNLQAFSHPSLPGINNNPQSFNHPSLPGINSNPQSFNHPSLPGINNNPRAINHPSLPEYQITADKSSSFTGISMDGIFQTPPVPDKKTQTHYAFPSLLIICLCLAALVLTSISITAAHMITQQQPDTTQNSTTSTSNTSTPLFTSANKSTASVQAGYIWCSTSCITNGFNIQYPTNWQLNSIADANGVNFVNPDQIDQAIDIKALGQTAETADTIMATDIQTNYMYKSGYKALNAARLTTIGGVTWTTRDLAVKDATGQTENITIYATVYKNDAFIIETQALQTQFAQASATYYNKMINQFQFTQ
ncbi:MAG TPA: zinc-ribbon domain-containing protein [Dictyobacter sp.]|nr:zinc-ribbon domain-containing protein [Dictyobacter sp.]